MSVPLELSSLQRDQQAMDTLEKQLICPICLEVFTKPVVILPCQHNLCRKCANELYQQSLFQTRSNMVGRFRCPSCRQEVVLDRHGVYGLQRNLLVENIIDVYKTGQEATSLRPPPPKSSKGHMTCEEHEDERVNIFCLSCQVPTCSLCKVFGAHKSCRVAPLPDVYQQQKAELSDGIGSLVTANSRVQAFIDDLEETCRKIEENCKNQKQTLCEKFERMLAILEERRKIMTQQISYEQEDKTGRAQALVRSHADNVDANAKLVEAALHTMEEPEMAVFIQSSRGLIEKVLEASRSIKMDTLDPAYENMNHYRVDFNAEERALYQLDFIKVEEEVPAEPEPEPEPEPEIEHVEPIVIPDPLPELVAEPVVVHDPAPELAVEPVSVEEPVPVWVSVSSLRKEAELTLLTNQGAQLTEEEEEEEEEEMEEVRGQAEGCAADLHKEELACDDDGLTTQQAVTLFFYLLLLLVILQRVWACVSCFICT